MFADAKGAYATDYATGDEFAIWPQNGKVIPWQESAKLFREHEERKRKQEAERQLLADKAARQVQDRWRAGVAGGYHAYASRKQLSHLHNALIDAGTGALMIPMWVLGATLVNMQLIYPEGTKRFITGARLKGAYSVLGSLDNAERVLVYEGWATGASLYELFESDGYQVVVAFNADNLIKVCQILRSRFEGVKVVVAGDDDRLNAVNVGCKKAIEAAEAIGASFAFPELCMCCTCSDFNDVAICERRRDHG